MRSSWTNIWTMIESRPRRIAAACLVAGLMLAPFAWAQAWAQDAAPPPAPPQQKPGVFESIGRWFDNGASSFRDHLRGAKRRMDELGDNAAANNKAISNQAAKVGQGAADVGKGAAHAPMSPMDPTKNAMGAPANLPTARMTTGP